MTELLKQYEILFNNMAEGVFFQNADGSMVDVNQAALDMFGLNRDQFMGRSSYDPEWKVIGEDGADLPPDMHPSMTALRTGKDVRDFVAGVYNPASKTIHWLIINAIPMFRDTSEAPHQVFVTLHEITKRKHEEERMRMLNDCFLNFGPDINKNINRLTAVIGTLMNASCALYNRLGNGMLCSIGQWQTPPGYQAIDTPDGHICFDVIRMENRAPLIIHDLDKTAYAETDPNVSLYGLKTYVGVPVFWTGQAVGSLCTVFCENYTPTEFDLSLMTLVAAALGVEEARWRAEEERENMQKQLLHAQKLESLGVLAGGIAHDFNNILTSIVGNAELALMRSNKESPVVDNLHRIENAAARAADLAKQMLAYSGKGRFVVEDINLNILLEEMLHILEVSISKKAVLRFNPHHPLPSVEADATQIRQIIMNLVINSSEAIGDNSGVIAITTGCMECDRNALKDVWLDENLTAGLYVYLEIADTGCGMDKETLSKLFDPFFTTKFTGRGLGMAAVLGIVRGHKGAIKVYSELNKGTTFKILLPASNRPADLCNVNTAADGWKGSGTVLLVDDEEIVRSIGREMLQELGFTVITAEDGMEGIATFKQNRDVAFVILDLTMPQMDGEQCFRELRQLQPDVKVIISSGFSEHEVIQKFAGKGLAGFIQKPYKLSVLKDVIREAGY